MSQLFFAPDVLGTDDRLYKVASDDRVYIWNKAKGDWDFYGPSFAGKQPLKGYEDEPETFDTPSPSSNTPPSHDPLEEPF